MEVIYTGEKYNKKEKLIFLAGPTPREEKIKSWRKEALDIFKKYDFKGNIYIPEFRHKSYYDNETGVKEMKIDQEMLENADVIMFWIPRNKDMLGLSTNVEFGYMLNKKNIVYGRPENADRCEFLDFLYKEKLNKDYLINLEDLVKETINYLKEEG